MASLVSSDASGLSPTHCFATVVDLMGLIDEESTPTSLSSSTSASVCVVGADIQWPHSFVLVFFSPVNSTRTDAGEGRVSQFLATSTNFPQQLSKVRPSPGEGEALAGVASALFFPDVRVEMSFGPREMSVVRVELLGGVVHEAAARRCAGQILAASRALAPGEQRAHLWVDFTGLLATTGVLRETWWAAASATAGAVVLVEKGEEQANIGSNSNKMEAMSTSSNFAKEGDAGAKDEHDVHDAEDDLPILEVYARRHAREMRARSASITSTKLMMDPESKNLHRNSLFEHDGDTNDKDDDGDDYHYNEVDDEEEDVPIFEIYARRERVRRFMLNYHEKNDSEELLQAHKNEKSEDDMGPASSSGSCALPKKQCRTLASDKGSSESACVIGAEEIGKLEQIEKTAEFVCPKQLSDRREPTNAEVLGTHSLVKPVQVIFEEFRGAAKGKERSERGHKNGWVVTPESTTRLNESVLMTLPTEPVLVSKHEKERPIRTSPPKKRARRLELPSVHPQTPVEGKTTEERDMNEDPRISSMQSSTDNVKNSIPCSWATPELMKSSDNKEYNGSERNDELTEDEEKVCEHLVDGVRHVMEESFVIDAIELPSNDVACLFVDVMGHNPSPGSDVAMRRLLASWSSLGTHNGSRAIVMITDGNVAFEQSIMSWVRVPWCENALMLPIFFIGDRLLSCTFDTLDTMPAFGINEGKQVGASEGIQDNASSETRRLLAFALRYFHTDVGRSACLALTEPVMSAARELGVSVVGNYECVAEWVRGSNSSADPKGDINVEAVREALFKNVCSRSELARALRDRPRRPEALMRCVGSIRLGIVRPVVCDALTLVSTAWREAQPSTILPISSAARTRIYQYASEFFTRDVFASAADMVHSCNADYFSAYNISTVGYFRYKLTSLLRRHVAVELQLNLQPLLLLGNNTESPHWSTVFKYLSCTCTPRNHERLLRTNTGEKKCRHLAQIFYWFMRSRSSTTTQPSGSHVVPSAVPQLPIIDEYIEPISERLSLGNVVGGFAVTDDKEPISALRQKEISERKPSLRTEESVWTGTAKVNSPQRVASATLPITTENGYSSGDVGKRGIVFEGPVTLGINESIAAVGATGSDAAADSFDDSKLGDFSHDDTTVVDFARLLGLTA